MEDIKLTSLLRVEERLAEASYFISQLYRCRNSETYQYNLNAFLSAARSVTFLLQKEMSNVPGFEEWWAQKRLELGKDETARFFLLLRNFSQKEGKVSLLGRRVARGKSAYWSFRFAGSPYPVPDSLIHRDLVDCCREHLAKISKALLEFADAFPFHACPTKALTAEGMQTLGLSVGNVLTALGYPAGWNDCRPEDESGKIYRVLQEHVDAVDFVLIQKLASYRPKQNGENKAEDFSDRMLRSMVNTMKNKDASSDEALFQWVAEEIASKES